MPPAVTDRGPALPSLAILGSGAVGRYFARGLADSQSQAGALMLWSREASRARELAQDIGRGVLAVQELERALGAQIVLLCVSDDALGDFAERCAALAGEAPPSGARTGSGAPRVALHVNGFHGAEILRPLAEVGWETGQLHPLVAVAPGFREGGPRESEPRAASSARPGSAYALSGSPGAVAAAESIIASLDGRPLRFAAEPADPAAYHAAASLLSGGLVVLFDAVERVVRAEAETDADTRGALLALARSILDNLERNRGNPALSLTGPIARGAGKLVASQLAALEGADPEAARLYRVLGRRMLHLALERGALDSRAAQDLERRLGPPRAD